MKEIEDLTLRVAPGEILPAGECPSCGAVCHVWEEAPKPFEAEQWFGDGDKVNGLVYLRLRDNKVWVEAGGLLHSFPPPITEVFDTLEEARAYLAKERLVKTQYWAVTGRIPFDDEDTLLAIECCPWEDHQDLYVRKLASMSGKAIPVNWDDTMQEGGEEWVYVLNEIQFKGPPVTP